MTQYIKLALRITQDIFNLSNFGELAIRYIQSTIGNWKQLNSKKFWSCLKCGLKFDLAITEKKEICTVCRIRSCLK